MTLDKSLGIALLCATAGILAVPAIAATVSGDKTRTLGSSRFHAGKVAAAAPTDSIQVKAFKNYTAAGYATGGIALRNRDGGVVHISGMHGITRAAWLYWAYLYPASAPPTPTQPATIQRLSPAGAPPRTATVTGTLIGTGADPCWGSAGNAVYRAPVPADIATGNGRYSITLDKAAIGLTSGEDPWVGPATLPLSEGASLVLIGDGTSNVSIYNKPLSGIEFDDLTPPLSYQLVLPLALTGSPILFDSIGADGQIGNSRHADGDAKETVSINGTIISGAGGLDPDSDWNGSAGFPLPQLWDDTGHDITGIRFASVPALNVTVQTELDCLVAVANVVSY